MKQYNWWDFASSADAAYKRCLTKESMGDDLELHHHNIVKNCERELKYIEAVARLYFPGYRMGGAALDVGCGGGYMTQCLSDAGFRSSGIDLSEAAITLAKLRHPALTFYAGDATNPDLGKDARFDLILFRAFHPFSRIDDFSFQWPIVEKYLALLTERGIIVIMNTSVKPRLDCDVLEKALRPRDYSLVGPFYPQICKRLKFYPKTKLEAKGLSCLSHAAGIIGRLNFGMLTLISKSQTPR